MITERRFPTTGGLEIDLGVGRPDWASLSPIEPRTARVLDDGMRAVYDPTGSSLNFRTAVTFERRDDG